MASAKFEKGSKEWHMFQDYWKICQKYWIPEESDGYWEALIQEADKFCQKYEDVPLAKKNMFGFLEVLEEKEKEAFRVK